MKKLGQVKKGDLAIWCTHCYTLYSLSRKRKEKEDYSIFCKNCNWIMDVFLNAGEEDD